MTTGAFSRLRRCMGLANSKLGKQKPKLGKSAKPKLGKAPPSLDDDDLPDTFTPVIALSKKELNSHSPLEVREQTFVDE